MARLRFAAIVAMLFFPVAVVLFHTMLAKPGPDDLEALKRSIKIDPPSTPRTVVVAGAWRVPPSDSSGKEFDDDASFFSHFPPPLWVGLRQGNADERDAAGYTSVIPTLSRMFRTRVLKATEVAVEQRVDRVVFTGGLGEALVSRAFVMRELMAPDDFAALLAQHGGLRGLETDENLVNLTVKLFARREARNSKPSSKVVQLLAETKSTTTEENAKFTMQLLANLSVTQPGRRHDVVTVSTPGHLRRCKIYFARALKNSKVDPSSRLFLVGSERQTSQYHAPRGLLVHPSVMDSAQFDLCFNISGKFPVTRRVVPLIRHHLGETPARFACAVFTTHRHHSYRFWPTVWSVPFFFELREQGALVVNVLQRKISLAEIRDLFGF